MTSHAPPLPYIVAATTQDERDLFALHRELYIEHRRAIIPPELIPLYAYRDFERILQEDVRSLLRDTHAFVFVARIPGQKDNTLAGYTTGRLRHEGQRLLSPHGVIEDWYVRPSWRAKGIGKALYHAMEMCFRQLGCAVLESATWGLNHDARAIHNHLGFHEIEVKYRKRID